MAEQSRCSAYFLLILQAHLPFVRHPEEETFLEENWLFEAISESYLPLLDMLARLEKMELQQRLAISFSPTLVTMLADSLLQDRYRNYLDRQLSLCIAERQRLQGRQQLEMVDFYYQRYQFCQQKFNDIYGDLISQFRHFFDCGLFELMTCSATHAFLPLYRSHSDLVQLQLCQGLSTFEYYFHRRPAGLWLPECGYYEGLEHHIKNAGFDFFVVSGNALEGGTTLPERGTFAPVTCKNGTTAFVTDHPLTAAIWDGKTGFPGKAVYRDFYRDVGIELPLDYLRPFLPCADRANVGLKYYAIGGMGEHPVYNVAAATQQAHQDAECFYQQLLQRAEQSRPLLDRPALLCCAYDAELFGHWWLEGPTFLTSLFTILGEQTTIAPIAPSDYLALYPDNQLLELCYSSWGDGGAAQCWLDSSNSWIYNRIYSIALNLREVIIRHRGQDFLNQRRMLNQAVRELLLAMSSDWPMIIAAGTMGGYAERRLKQHLRNCQVICQQIAAFHYCDQRFTFLENKNNIFPDLDYNDFICSHNDAQQHGFLRVM